MTHHERINKYMNLLDFYILKIYSEKEVDVATNSLVEITNERIENSNE